MKVRSSVLTFITEIRWYTTNANSIPASLGFPCTFTPHLRCHHYTANLYSAWSHYIVWKHKNTETFDYIATFAPSLTQTPVFISLDALTFPPNLKLWRIPVPQNLQVSTFFRFMCKNGICWKLLLKVCGQPWNRFVAQINACVLNV
jgi:hypothetical protein